MSDVAYEPIENVRPCQGAIYRDVTFILGLDIDSEDQGVNGIESFVYPYAVVLSQECDLTQDSKARESSQVAGGESSAIDKIVPSVLLCPAYQAEKLREGTHIEEAFGVRVPRKTNPIYSQIERNNSARFHYLSGYRPLQVPECVLDFKHFFTLPTETLVRCYGNTSHLIARLSGAYCEEVSQRFASFLSRIGVPVPHNVLQDKRTASPE